MTTVQVSPELVQTGDQVKIKDSVFTVKFFESDLNGSYDFYVQNESGIQHEIVTESITLIV